MDRDSPSLREPRWVSEVGTPLLRQSATQNAREVRMKRAMTIQIRHAAQFLGLWLIITVVLAFGTPEMARRPPEHEASPSICRAE
jgi:hypothetical protein